MKTTYISTYALASATRRSMLEMQQELAIRQKEVSTGRVADAGLALGAQTGQAVALRREHASIETMIASNAVAASRLDSTQEALSAIGDEATEFLGVLIEAKGNPATAADTATRAREKLTSFIGQLNASHAGEYIFAGINTDQSPLEDYFAPGSTAKQAVDAAFLAKFGITQSDPAVANISATDMQDFLDNEFAALFDATGWSSDWSSASDNVSSGWITSGTAATTGVTANSAGLQKIAMAYTMVTDLGIGQLSEQAYTALINEAMDVLSSGMDDVTDMRTSIGATQERITNASERLSLQKDVIANHIGALENVDPYEASTRVTTLLTQIETSYAMTARIQQLSLIDFI